MAKNKPRFGRNQAMAAQPQRLPTINCREEEDGGLAITVELEPHHWARWFGSNRVRRTFTLDTLGREVYDACDGEASVRAIIRDFAKQHHVSIPEAEHAVTKFLKTLISKGLVAMAVERPERK
jgi:hypothetical protein